MDNKDIALLITLLGAGAINVAAQTSQTIKGTLDSKTGQYTLQQGNSTPKKMICKEILPAHILADGMKSKEVLLSKNNLPFIWYNNQTNNINIWDKLNSNPASLEKAIRDGTANVAIDQHNRLWLGSGDNYVTITSTNEHSKLIDIYGKVNNKELAKMSNELYTGFILYGKCDNKGNINVSESVRTLAVVFDAKSLGDAENKVKGHTGKDYDSLNAVLARVSKQKEELENKLKDYEGHKLIDDLESQESLKLIIELNARLTLIQEDYSKLDTFLESFRGFDLNFAGGYGVSDFSQNQEFGNFSVDFTDPKAKSWFIETDLKSNSLLLKLKLNASNYNGSIVDVNGNPIGNYKGSTSDVEVKGNYVIVGDPNGLGYWIGAIVDNHSNTIAGKINDPSGDPRKANPVTGGSSSTGVHAGVGIAYENSLFGVFVGTDKELGTKYGIDTRLDFPIWQFRLQADGRYQLFDGENGTGAISNFDAKAFLNGAISPFVGVKIESMDQTNPASNLNVKTNKVGFYAGIRAGIDKLIDYFKK